MSAGTARHLLRFRTLVDQARFSGDQLCERCGYNLNGLVFGSRCPECGSDSPCGLRPNDPLLGHPEGVRGRIGWGLTIIGWMLLIGLSGRLVIFLMGLFGVVPVIPRAYIGLVLTETTLIAIGAWLATPNTFAAHVQRFDRWQWAIRAGAALWTAGSLCWLLLPTVPAGTASDQLLRVAALAGRGLGASSLVIMAVFYMDVARRAGLDAAADRLRWIWPVVLFTIFAAVAPAVITWVAAILLLLLLFAWALMLIPVSRAFIEIGSTACWAERLVDAGVGREDRIAAKRAELTAQACSIIRPLPQDRPGMVPAMMVDRLCAGCGHNLRGLPYGSRCPECGRSMRESHAPDEPIARCERRDLRTLLIGSSLAFLSWLALLVGFVTLSILTTHLAEGTVLAAVLMMLPILGLSTASWFLTPVIRHPDAGHYGFGERSWIRWPLRAALPVGLLMIGAWHGIVHAPLGAAGDAVRLTMRLLFGASFIGFVIGSALLGVQMRRLAEWTRDGGAASALNLSVWMAALMTPVIALDTARSIASSGTGPIFDFARLSVLILIALAFLIGVLSMLYGLGMLTGSLVMSQRHHDDYLEFDARRLDRGREFAEQTSNRARRAGVP